MWHYVWAAHKMSENLPLHGIQIVLNSVGHIGMWAVIQHGDSLNLFTLLFVLDPVMQILKSLAVTVYSDCLYIIWSPKAGVPSTSENTVNSTLPVDVCDMSFLSSWSRVSPLVFLWVQNGDTQCQHVPQCPRNSSLSALALCMQSYGMLDIIRHTSCGSHIHWDTMSTVYQYC